MLKPKRLNQRAIAKATGVSRATVSLVLRGGAGAAEETRTKVLEAAAKMGYRPNALVHSIRSGKSRTVGVMVAPHDSFWQRVCYGIHDRLVEAEHLPLFLWDTERHEDDRETYALKQIHRLLDRWVDGAILWPTFADYYAIHLKEFELRNIPLVTIDHIAPGLKADTILSDEAAIARLSLRHLVSLGHRNIFVVGGPPGVGWADGRFMAVSREIKAIGKLDPIIERYAWGDDIVGSVKEILSKNPRITAIAAATDQLARKCYRAAHDLGLKIPSDLSVIGVGDLNFSELMMPSLTSVRQDGYAIGRKAAQIELERGAGILSGPPRVFQIGVELVVRESTGKARVK